MSKTALMPEPQPYIHYETTELGLATYLHILGARPISIDRLKPNSIVFHFELTDEQRDSVINYYSSYNAIKQMVFEK